MPNAQLGLIAIVFVMAGLCFRVAAVPLHFYAPDVYQGSPTVIAAVLSWVPKAVGFLAMIRALTAVFSATSDDRWCSKAVMLSLDHRGGDDDRWATSSRCSQENLKRLLAYSSIAHAGYLMIGVAVAFANGQHGTELYHGTEGILFYLVAYALMTLGAFGVIIALRIGDRPVETVRRPRRPGLDAALAGAGAGDLPAQPQRHPAAAGLLGQVRDLRLGAGGAASWTSRGRSWCWRSWAC